MPTTLIDTVSLNHALKATHRKLDYSTLMEYILNTYGVNTFTFFVDEDAKAFHKYIGNVKEGEHQFDKTIFTKRPYRKRIGPGDRIWYISFAVEIGLVAQGGDIVISCDSEILPVLKKHAITLMGLGIPHELRDAANYWDNIPDECYT